jgi:hypothetical protein
MKGRRTQRPFIRTQGRLSGQAATTQLSRRGKTLWAGRRYTTFTNQQPFLSRDTQLTALKHLLNHRTLDCLPPEAGRVVVDVVGQGKEFSGSISMVLLSARGAGLESMNCC